MILYYNKGNPEKTPDIVRKTMQIVRPKKKNGKKRKKGLTIPLASGILTKLFDGDEVQKVERVWIWKRFEKSAWQNELSLI